MGPITKVTLEPFKFNPPYTVVFQLLNKISLLRESNAFNRSKNTPITLLPQSNSLYTSSTKLKMASTVDKPGVYAN